MLENSAKANALQKYRSVEQCQQQQQRQEAQPIKKGCDAHTGVTWDGAMMRTSAGTSTSTNTSPSATATSRSNCLVASQSWRQRLGRRRQRRRKLARRLAGSAGSGSRSRVQGLQAQAPVQDRLEHVVPEIRLVFPVSAPFFPKDALDPTSPANTNQIKSESSRLPKRCVFSASCSHKLLRKLLRG